MPSRIHRTRTKGWTMPENTIYVGRGSKWGNPFTLQFVGTWFGLVSADHARDKACTLYRKWMAGTIEPNWTDEVPPAEDIDELRGKNLACWCKPDQPCHADVLLELANR